MKRRQRVAWILVLVVDVGYIAWGAGAATLPDRLPSPLLSAQQGGRFHRLDDHDARFEQPHLMAEAIRQVRHDVQVIRSEPRGV